MDCSNVIFFGVVRFVNAPNRDSREMRRVLIVEDNEDAGTSMLLLLQSFGHEAHLARNGKAAVLAAAQLKPDVILMDIALPDIDGYEAARQIRAALAGEPITIIALTVKQQPHDKEAALAAGMDLHLAKPVSAESLRAAVDLPNSPRR